MGFTLSKIGENARGGSELIRDALIERLPGDLLTNFQIFTSRVEEELDPTKVRILHIQDLCDDPTFDHLKDGGWRKFNKFVFPSHHTMNSFIKKFSIPWSHCVVIRNGIKPIEWTEKPSADKIKLIYHSTPHRGLNILYAVFDKLAQEIEDIELNVYSSFRLYGWQERDEQFKELFAALEAHPKINYYGTVDNSLVREALVHSHIFTYPSIWEETSCISLMEAISAGCLAVHSNLGALPETSCNFTYMYGYNEDVNNHASLFYAVLKDTIREFKSMNSEQYHNRIMTAKSYYDLFYNIELISKQWNNLLLALVNEPREIVKDTGPRFVYDTCA